VNVKIVDETLLASESTEHHLLTAFGIQAEAHLALLTGLGRATWHRQVADLGASKLADRGNGRATIKPL
jgi:hypothetical protein